MKSLKKYLFVALCCTAATVFTSCLNGNDDYAPANPPLTQAEKRVQLANMQGSYSGISIRFALDSYGSQYISEDTTNISFAVQDSTITVYNLPLSQFVRNASETVKAAVGDAKADIKCPFMFYRDYSEYDYHDIYRFAVWGAGLNDQAWKMDFAVNDSEGKAHTLTVTIGTGGVYGARYLNEYIYSKRGIIFTLFPSSVAFDGNKVVDYPDFLEISSGNVYEKK